MDLPSVIPLFALPNVVLFPGVPLPLHVFEPRYRQMVRDTHAAHDVIGVVLLRGDWKKDYEGNPDIFEVGCAGKIVNVEALADGRYNILLHGMREFVIQRQFFDRPYRQAEVSWRSSRSGALEGSHRSGLIRCLSEFLGPKLESPAYRLLHDESLTDELLVNFFSYALDIEALEKQDLLEAPTLVGRAQRLSEILEFHVDELRLAVKRSGPERCH